MDNVLDSRAAADRAAADIRAQFEARGTAVADQRQLEISPASWRRIARSVARSMHRPVRTFALGPLVHAVLSDWPRDAREQAIHEREMQSPTTLARSEPRRDLTTTAP